jgi:hypothetical protein
MKTMSKKLALSSALSVLLMAGFALFGQDAAREGSLLSASSELTGRVAMPALPGAPLLPLTR